MHTQTHLVISWLAGHRLAARRDRVLEAWAGVLPDLDGLAVLAGGDAYEKWHHTFGHGLAGAMLVSALAATFGRRRVSTAILAFVVFHLHLACDLLGADQWPIFYFWPWSTRGWTVPFGWPLDSWQNWVAMLAALALSLRIALVRGRTFAETFLPQRADAAIAAALRQRFCRSSQHGTARTATDAPP